jgi:hypothetical protein
LHVNAMQIEKVQKGKAKTWKGGGRNT